MRKVTTGVNFDGKTQADRWFELSGTGVFVTTGTEVVVYHDFKEILSVQITPIHASAAAAAANGQLTATGFTINSDGSLRPTTAGQLVVERIAGTDSALAFSITIKGR